MTESSTKTFLSTFRTIPGSCYSIMDTLSHLRGRFGHRLHSFFCHSNDSTHRSQTNAKTCNISKSTAASTCQSVLHSTYTYLTSSFLLICISFHSHFCCFCLCFHTISFCLSFFLDLKRSCITLSSNNFHLRFSLCLYCHSFSGSFRCCFFYLLFFDIQELLRIQRFHSHVFTVHRIIRIIFRGQKTRNVELRHC